MDSIRFNNKRKEMAISCWLKFISIENIYIYIRRFSFSTKLLDDIHHGWI